MGLCKAIFKKDIYELELSDVIDFFSIPQEETSVLEFKSSDVSLEQVHREVGAFLNTEGGLLILGAPKESKIGNIKKCVGEIAPCTIIMDQDTLLRSVASNITPSPSGVKARSFEYGRGFVYVLEIPPSLSPPHQVSNEGKYYIRLEREAKPAPHGLVDALFNRRQSPNLIAEIEISVLNNNGLVKFDFTLENSSLISAEHVGIMIDVYGVREMVRARNFSSNAKRVDDQIKIYEVLPNTLLAQGISVRFSLEVMLRHRFAFVSFSYYCKNTRLEIKQALFYAYPFTILNNFDSKAPSGHPGNSGQIISQFRLMKEDWIRERLINLYPNLTIPHLPATEEEINGLASELRIDLPESYVQFFLITNGFDGFIHGCEIRLFGTEMLAHKSTVQVFHEQSFIQIGYIGNSPIFIVLDEQEIVSFEWDYPSQNNSSQNNTSHSFYGFLQSLMGYPA